MSQVRFRTPSVCAVAALLLMSVAGTAWAVDSDGDGVADGIDVCCNTPPGVPVDSVGRPLADLDDDCDVDMVDFGIFQVSLTGPMNCSPEICDGIDNDCNCIVDDVGTITCGTGACQVTVPSCVNGVPQTCTPGASSPEICNGIDDDCDGMVDEGLTGCGSNCPGNPQPEICDGIDNDCDALVDEGLVGCCPGNPQPEICNGIDDDCDGMVDEGLTGCGSNCPGNPQPEVCDGIDNDCDGMVDEGLVGCCPGNPQPEICDGIDNDCNGVTDDGSACPAVPNAVGVCDGVSCTYVCDPGYSDCNGTWNDGCEVNIATDVQNCGTCNAVCSAGPNAVALCSASSCSYVCYAGYVDCNANPADGCEVNVFSSPNHCGGCNVVCPTRPNAVTVCSAGNCSFVCNAGYAACNGNASDGCEVNLNTDVSHCGACNSVCQPGDVCVNGQCETN